MASADNYDVGDAYRLIYTLTDANGVPTNATVVLTVTRPDGTTDITAPTNPATGTYIGVGACTLPGTWLYRFVATGALSDAEPGQFFVEATANDRVYATVPELKSRLAIPGADTVDDTELVAAVDTASRAVDADCQRHFWKTTEARTFAPCDWYRLKLGAFNDLVSVTTLKTDPGGDGTFELTWATADYQLLTADNSPNVNAGPEPRPYTQVRAVGNQQFPIAYYWATRRNVVEITGVWGWPAVPADVRQACLILAAEQFKLKDAPLGSAVGIADLGIIRVRENPQADRLLQPYRKFPRNQDGQPMFAA